MGYKPRNKDRTVYGLSTVQQLEDGSTTQHKYFNPDSYSKESVVTSNIENTFRHDGVFYSGMYDVTSSVADTVFVDDEGLLKTVEGIKNTYNSNNLMLELKGPQTAEQIKKGNYSIIDNNGFITQQKLGNFLNKLDNWYGLSRLPLHNQYVPHDPMLKDKTYYSLADYEHYPIFPPKTYDMKNNSSLIIPNYDGATITMHPMVSRVGEVRYVVSSTGIGRNIQLKSSYDKTTNELSLEDLPLNMRVETSHQLIIFINGIQFTANGRRNTSTSTNYRWIGAITSNGEGLPLSERPVSWENKYITVTEYDSKYSRDGVIRKSRYPFLDFDMISYDLSGAAVNYLTSDVSGVYPIDTDLSLSLIHI